MCAKVISQNEFPHPLLETATESLTTDDAIPTLEELGEVLGKVMQSPVSVLGEDHIRISTPELVDEEEILSLREYIANSLFLPVNIFRERNYIEITAI